MASTRTDYLPSEIQVLASAVATAMDGRTYPGASYFGSEEDIEPRLDYATVSARSGYELILKDSRTTRPTSELAQYYGWMRSHLESEYRRWSVRQEHEYRNCILRCDITDGSQLKCNIYIYDVQKVNSGVSIPYTVTEESVPVWLSLIEVPTAASGTVMVPSLGSVVFTSARDAEMEVDGVKLHICRRALALLATAVLKFYIDARYN